MSEYHSTMKFQFENDIVKKQDHIGSSSSSVKNADYSPKRPIESSSVAGTDHHQVVISRDEYSSLINTI
jgi:hypothetical protein